MREALSGQLDWLLVFDNAEAPSGVRAFLPREGSGHVLVTSRNPAWRGLGRVLELGLAVEPPPGAGGDPPRAGG